MLQRCPGGLLGVARLRFGILQEAPKTELPPMLVSWRTVPLGTLLGLKPATIYGKIELLLM